MSGLDRINGEVLSVPGLRFWGRRFPGHKFSVCCGDERGTVEVWHFDHADLPTDLAASAAGLGGVELHSPVSLYGQGEPDFTDCPLVPGDGRCWVDGSSLAYSDTFAPLVAAGDSQGVLAELAAWHESHFGESGGAA